MNSGRPRLHTVVVSLVFAVLCAGLGSALLILPGSDWSDNENRRLSSFPEFSGEALADGSYLAGVEDYLTDHFPLRDMFVSLSTRYSLLTGRREINGVYVCDDGFLIDKYEAPVNVEGNLAAFRRLTDGTEGCTVTLMTVPTAACIYSEKLPFFSENADQRAVIGQYAAGFDGVTVDVTDTLLAHKNEHQLYYRTDHHWTTWGAYYAYAELCVSLGLEAIPAGEFSVECVTEDFRGTTYSKLNDFTIDGEAMYRFNLPGQELTVEYDGRTSGESGSGGLYNSEYLAEKDKYSYFLDNIHEMVIVRNENARTDREIAVVKDSYANCLVPFLAEHFSTVYVFDTRYYRRPVTEFISEHTGITDVLVLYNLGTMDADTGIRGII